MGGLSERITKYANNMGGLSERITKFAVQKHKTEMNTTAKEIIEYMESLQNEEQRCILMGFFKTGPGEYGEGDEFLGLNP